MVFSLHVRSNLANEIIVDCAFYRIELYSTIQQGYRI